MTTTVRDNPEKGRYEILDGELVAGFSQYEMMRGMIAFTHTEVDEAFSGRGLARELVTKALDDVRERGLQVLPFCAYVHKVVAGSPDYLELVPAMVRAQFNLPLAD